jgi:hypothetical protein
MRGRVIGEVIACRHALTTRRMAGSTQCADVAQQQGAGGNGRAPLQQIFYSMPPNIFLSTVQNSHGAFV